MSVLNERLQNFNYYLEKLPLYLRDSSNFSSHFKLWFDLLTSEKGQSIVGVIDNIFDILDCVTGSVDDYLSRNENCSDMLDKIASIYGISRYLTINDEPITLSDSDLLVLIRCTIIKNHFDGTFELLKYLYYQIGLHVAIYTNNNTVCEMMLLCGDLLGDIYTDNVKTMFEAGLLTVQSLGITYIFQTVDIGSAAFFSEDDDPNDTVFDGRRVFVR